MPYVKRPVRKNNRRNIKNRRNAKKAYAPRRKARMVRQLKPIAEQRKSINIQNDWTTLGSEWRVQIPDSWEKVYRENALETHLDNQPTTKGFTGRTLFSRYLNQYCKINFENITHSNVPVQLRVMYGWCKVNYQTIGESAGGSLATNANGVYVSYNPEEMITKLLDAQFTGHFPTNDPKKFKLLFNRSYYLSGRTTTTKQQIPGDGPGGPTEIEVFTTHRPELKFYPKWRTNKKYHMTPATRGNGIDGHGNPVKPDNMTPANLDSQENVFFTPSHKTNRNLWTPFFAVRFENREDFGTDIDGEANVEAYPRIIQKNAHYFMDL